MSRPTLGIMALYLSDNRNFEEWHFFKRLFITAAKLNLDLVLFSPEDVNSAEKQVRAHVYDVRKSRWVRKFTALPAIIYDRCRFTQTERFARFKQFRANHPHLTFLSHPMANKWTVHQILYKDPAIRAHLPATILYRDDQSLFRFIKNRNTVYLKPKNGTGGRGILRIERLNNGLFNIQGRARSRQMIPGRIMDLQQIKQHFSTWKLENNYLIQQGIRLKLTNGRVHDYRMLVQKNGQGQWEITGCVGRIGPQGSVTSNLHGGGKTSKMDTLLQHLFNPQQIATIRNTLKELGINTANKLDSHFGKLCELGLDIAVDNQGKVWLLEVNPKPAREVFARVGDKAAYRKAISRPLEYALWTAQQLREKVKVKEKEKEKEVAVDGDL